MKILRYGLGVLLTLLLLALAVEAQIQVDRWLRIQHDMIAKADTLYNTADTLDQTKIVRLYTKEMPYNKWTIGVLLDTFAGKDPADTVRLRWWYLVNPGEGWSAKTQVDSIGKTGAWGPTRIIWQYFAIPLPVVKPCSVKMDLWAKDANTCSTKVKGLRFIAQ